MKVFANVAHAVGVANKTYNDTLDANNGVIEAAEEWVNSHRPSASEVMSALEAGKLRRSQTSGRLFIQLRRYV